MPNPLTPEEWADRAGKADLEWLKAPPNSSTPTPARCVKCGHEWKLRPGHLLRGTKCPECAKARRRVPKQEWDRRANQAGIRILTYPQSTMRDKIRVQCLTCNREWETLTKAINWEHACTPCRRKHQPRKQPKPPRAVSREEWDRRAAAVGIKWLEQPRGNNGPFKAECLTCGHQYGARPPAVYTGKGCRKCAARAQRLSPEEWNHRASEVGIEWLEAPKTRRTKTPARCLTCSYEWLASPGFVATNKTGCPKCGNAVPITPEEWKERASSVGIEWLEQPRTAVSKTQARCLKCGYEWEAWPSHIHAGSGCPACANLLPITNDEWDRRISKCGMEWVEYPPTISQRGIARCLTCSYEGPKFGVAATSGQRCPVCTDAAFDPEAPSLVYLITLPEEGLLKIGKTNTTARNDRLGTHKRRGWQVVETWSTKTGAKATLIEQAVLAYWGERGAIAVNREDVPEGDGYTETIRMGRVDIPETTRLVNSIVSIS